jgi:hypothetical protein
VGIVNWLFWYNSNKKWFLIWFLKFDYFYLKTVRFKKKNQTLKIKSRIIFYYYCIKIVNSLYPPRLTDTKSISIIQHLKTYNKIFFYFRFTFLKAFVFLKFLVSNKPFQPPILYQSTLLTEISKKLSFQNWDIQSQFLF